MRMPASASAGTIDSFQHAYCWATSCSVRRAMRCNCASGFEAVGRRVLRQHVAERLLAQPGHADHEELVQVRREDRQELHPLQQRIVRVLGLFQHARVELQPAQLAVDEVLGQKRRLARCSYVQFYHAAGDCDVAEAGRSAFSPIIRYSRKFQDCRDSVG